MNKENKENKEKKETNTEKIERMFSTIQENKNFIIRGFKDTTTDGRILPNINNTNPFAIIYRFNFVDLNSMLEFVSKNTSEESFNGFVNMWMLQYNSWKNIVVVNDKFGSERIKQLGLDKVENLFGDVIYKQATMCSLCNKKIKENANKNK